MATGKLLIIGLDSAAPALVFDRWRDRLPTLAGLMARGGHGRLLSSNPPITVPAWTCMMTSRDPGQLGCYGFRNRRDRSYDGWEIATSTQVRTPRLWDRVGAAGKRSIVLGVPQTWPPRALHGEMVSCFLTPSTRAAYTYPATLKDEVEAVTDGYVIDVEDYRTEDKAGLLERIYAKTRKHLRLAQHMLRTRPWDLAMVVEMGTDRIQHAFWAAMDAGHRRHDPDGPFGDAILEYYRFVDSELAGILDCCPADTAVMVVSDHGAKKMDGGVCFNEWLRAEGHLCLNGGSTRPGPLRTADVDWDRTRAWGDGGYYGRVFLNVRGREPRGIVDPADYERVRDDLIAGIEAICDPDGRPLRTRAVRPEEVYAEVNGVAPDLLVYFDDLGWRSVGSLGDGALHRFDNDTGPDDANHDWHGIFVLSSAGAEGAPVRGDLGELSLYDVMPTALSLMGQPVPHGCRGQALC